MSPPKSYAETLERKLLSANLHECEGIQNLSMLRLANGRNFSARMGFNWDAKAEWGWGGLRAGSSQNGVADRILSIQPVPRPPSLPKLNGGHELGWNAGLSEGTILGMG